MTSNLTISGRNVEAQVAGAHILPGNAINLEKLLRCFREFMKDAEWDFLERNGRLIFLAFLQTILNQQGSCIQIAGTFGGTPPRRRHHFFQPKVRRRSENLAGQRGA